MNSESFTYTVKHDVLFGRVTVQSNEYNTIEIPFQEPMSDKQAINKAKDIMERLDQLSTK